MDLVAELRVTNADLADRLRLRQEESDNLRDLLKGSAEELVSLQVRLRESREQVSSLNTEIIPLRHQFQHLTRKMAMLEKRDVDMEAALAGKKRELASKEKGLGDLAFEASAQLRTVRCDLEQARFKASALEDQLSLSHERNDQLLRQVQDLEVTSAQRFAAYDQEVDRKDALLAIYSDRCQVAERRVQDAGRDFALFKEEQEKHQADVIEVLNKKHAAALDSDRIAVAARIKAAEESAAAVAITVAPRHTADQMLYPDDLYKAYETAKQEIVSERGARREAELYLSKILRELEAKAPVFLRQKTQCAVLQQEKDRVVARMEAVLRENALLRDHLNGIEEDADAAVEEAASLRALNADLSRQLQHLLNSDADMQAGSSGGMDIVSERLVTFVDIQELQTRNAQLLKVVRSLSADPDALLRREERGAAERSRDNKQLSDTLASALTELGHMRDARSKAEELLFAALQQRDELREMLPSHVAATASGGKENLRITNGTGASPTRPTGDDGEIALKRVQLRCDSLLAEAAQLRKEKDEAISAHGNIQATLRAELGSLRGRLAHAEGQMRSASDKSDRLERSMSSLRVECASTVDARLELEMLVSDLERRLHTAENEAQENTKLARAAEDSSRAADTEAELARSAEYAAVEALAALHEKLKTEAILSESLRRVESGLSSRHQEEKAALACDRDALSRDLQVLRKQLHEMELLSTQRCAALDAELVLCRASLDERSAEAHEARLLQVRQEGQTKGALERAALLERQLLHTQERMSALQGVTSMDELLLKQATENQVALSRARDAAADANALAALAEQHAEDFQAIALAAEAKWKELHDVHAAASDGYKAEVAALNAALSEARGQVISDRERTASLNAAFEAASAELRSLKAENDAQITENEAALGAARAEAAAQRSLCVQQEAEIVRLNHLLAASEGSLAEHRMMLKTATEAQMAATAEAQRTATALNLNNQAIAELSASSVVQQLQLSEDKNKAERAVADLQEKGKDLRRSNDLLHSQMQILSARVRRFEEDRSRGSAPSTGDDAAAEEQAQLRVSLDELREVLGIIKRERDTLSAKLAVAESEAARYQSAAAALQGAMDEVRLTSKRENDKSAPTRGESEFERLLLQVQQLGKVREQAQSVHADNERLSQTNDKLARELQVIKDGAAPRERQVRVLQAEKLSLDAQVAQLNKERGEWVARLQEVMERYRDVDPSEYRALREREIAAREALSAAQAQLQQSTLTVVELKKDQTVALTAKDAELAALRQAKEALEKSCDNLRNTMRQLKARAESSQESTKEMEALKAELEVLRAAAAAHEQIDAETRVMMEEEEEEAEEEEQAAVRAAASTAAAAPLIAGEAGRGGRKRSQPEPTPELAIAPSTLRASAASLNPSVTAAAATAALDEAAAGAMLGRAEGASTEDRQREMERMKALLIQSRQSSRVAAKPGAPGFAAAAGDEPADAGLSVTAPPNKRNRPARSASIINSGPAKGAANAASSEDSSADVPLASVLKPSAAAFVPSASSAAAAAATVPAPVGSTFGTGAHPSPFKSTGGGFFGGSNVVGAAVVTGVAASPADAAASDETSEEALAKAKRAARFSKDGGSTGE